MIFFKYSFIFKSIQGKHSFVIKAIEYAGLLHTLGKKGCYTPGWCVFFVIISISSVREV